MALLFSRNEVSRQINDKLVNPFKFGKVTPLMTLLIKAERGSRLVSVPDIDFHGLKVLPTYATRTVSNTPWTASQEDEDHLPDFSARASKFVFLASYGQQFEGNDTLRLQVALLAIVFPGLQDVGKSSWCRDYKQSRR
ncbi:hypothetical protein GLAREA_00936 [Glarea lozoyensis ATCC 20868]|uniref:Uncharacterized protein n=1 Tax=Glarea lozoyensis (strain ATCC 20868 / MF5171) TaxID=1116229 RepID=S3DCT5_GLAL2|nr:uncharacterized protein GLAREA_00936 [Glarea lozoyensis ATCC 20868]EPE29776.1 hypothetical protein GLAREA_00936 [Glarea lozoyensis ATCC 20868]